MYTQEQIKIIIRDIYHFIRSQSQLTKIFGPKYMRSQKSIEIDITYRCNLRCPNCNRSCTQAPTKEEMKIEQIEDFIKDSIDNNIKWERIRILGGEPTLHTKLFDILDLLLKYKNKYNPNMHISISTNGYGNRVKEILAKLPKEIEITNSSKNPTPPTFFHFNIAPRDDILYRNVDYSNGCWILEACGMGLTPYGYYPCAVAGGIDRIFNFDIGRKKLPSRDDLMINQLKTFCSLCGHFRFSLPSKQLKISPSWKLAYQAYNDKLSKSKDTNEAPNPG